LRLDEKYYCAQQINCGVVKLKVGAKAAVNFADLTIIKTPKLYKTFSFKKYYCHGKNKA